MYNELSIFVKKLRNDMNAFRIGLIVPSSNTTLEPEFHLMARELNVTIHSSRIYLEKVKTDSLIQMKEEVDRAAKELKSAHVDVIVFGCTTGSLIGGIGYDKELYKQIVNITNLPVVIVSSAVIEWLNNIKAKRIFVLTPYTDDINNLERKFFEDSNIEVIGMHGLGIVNNTEIGYISGEKVKNEAIRVFQNSDALFISCTNLSTVGIIEELEKQFGCPVISSNSAAFRMTLKTCGIITPPALGRFGSIFNST
jgi:maleate isomerase